MLQKPKECLGCPLNPYSSGFMVPQKGTNGVVLLGEALGENEAEEGSPFVGKAGLRLTRLIEWAGFKREDFTIANAVWCRPPGNKLEGQFYEAGAIKHCRTAHWAQIVQAAKVTVPLGNVPTNALIGKKSILTNRGYVWASDIGHVIPTVHPSYIQRGNAKWSAAFINDIQKAVELSKTGLPINFSSYSLDPSPLAAYRWAQEYVEFLRNNPETYLAFDIETPGKGDDEEDLDSDSDAPDKSWHIERIGFAYKPYGALSIPWEPSYLAAIRTLLSTDGAKVVWNAGFDVPRIRRAGVDIKGTIHDGMVAWHILHTDLPKRLGFVATFTCPWQPAWKHLSGAKPAFYNATDADVELRSMLRIEHELKKSSLWEVYQKDVLDLEPILVHMQQAGMPVDSDIRLDRAIKLDEELKQTRNAMESKVPLEARRIEHVYKNTPKDATGLLHRRGLREVPVCSICGTERPTKPHFRRLKKRQNPCADGQVTLVTREVQEFYRLAEFTPSRDQLIRYHEFLDRPCPRTFDKKERKQKISFAEKQLKELRLKYPDDIIYELILKYRALDKLAGTYIGRPFEG